MSFYVSQGGMFYVLSNAQGMSCRLHEVREVFTFLFVKYVKFCFFSESI